MSISAQDWVDQSVVAPAIFDRWPDYQVTLVAVDVIDDVVLAAAADELIEKAQSQSRASDSLGTDPHTLRWHDAYRHFGVKPRVARASADALVRRAATESGLPRINPLVDVYNAISVLNLVPVGGEDLDRYDGAARLDLSGGNEPFHTNRNGEAVVEYPEIGEPIWVDGGGVTCRRWNWRQTTRTAIHDRTRRIGFILDSLDSPAHRGAANAAEHLLALFPDAATRTIAASGAV